MTLTLLCAFVASILAGVAALDLMPQTALGRTAAFAIWMVTLFPIDRLMESTRPAWHHWFGTAIGVLIVWIGHTLTMSGAIPERTSILLNIVVAGLVLASLGYHFVRTGRRGV